MQKYHCRDFHGDPVVKISPSSAESGGLTLVTQLRSHMHLGQKPKQNSVVTNSTETF